MDTVPLCEHGIILGSIHPCEECEINHVLSEWRSLVKIANMLRIDEDGVFEKVFTGRNIIQKKLEGHAPRNSIILYKIGD